MQEADLGFPVPVETEGTTQSLRNTNTEAFVTESEPTDFFIYITYKGKNSSIRHASSAKLSRGNNVGKQGVMDNCYLRCPQTRKTRRYEHKS
jgi:hypothetical protein